MKHFDFVIQREHPMEGLLIFVGIVGLLIWGAYREVKRSISKARADKQAKLDAVKAAQDELATAQAGQRAAFLDLHVQYLRKLAEVQAEPTNPKLQADALRLGRSYILHQGLAQQGIPRLSEAQLGNDLMAAAASVNKRS